MERDSGEGQGTRSAKGTLLPFKSGAFRLALEAGVAVLPVAVHGTAEGMPKGGPWVRPCRAFARILPPVEAGRGVGDTVAPRDEVRRTIAAELPAEQARGAAGGNAVDESLITGSLARGEGRKPDRTPPARYSLDALRPGVRASARRAELNCCIIASTCAALRISESPSSSQLFVVTVAEQCLPMEIAVADRRAVLLVDDDVAIREVIESILDTEGYRVVTAAEGAEALCHLRSGLRPGVILLDLRMPGMDGRAFRELQSAEPELAGIPVVILSGDWDAARVAGSLGAGWLLKPIDLDRLLSVVERHCGSPT